MTFSQNSYSCIFLFVKLKYQNASHYLATEDQELRFFLFSKYNLSKDKFSHFFNSESEHFLHECWCFTEHWFQRAKKQKLWEFIANNLTLDEDSVVGITLRRQELGIPLCNWSIQENYKLLAFHSLSRVLRMITTVIRNENVVLT